MNHHGMPACPWCVAQVPAAPKQASYVKDDFFDQLSCDTLERLHLHEEGGEGLGPCRAGPCLPWLAALPCPALA